MFDILWFISSIFVHLKPYFGDCKANFSDVLLIFNILYISTLFSIIFGHFKANFGFILAYFRPPKSGGQSKDLPLAKPWGLSPPLGILASRKQCRYHCAGLRASHCDVNPVKIVGHL